MNYTTLVQHTDIVTLIADISFGDMALRGYVAQAMK